MLAQPRLLSVERPILEAAPDAHDKTSTRPVSTHHRGPDQFASPPVKTTHLGLAACGPPAREFGGRPFESDPLATAPMHLTKRQLEVLRLLAEGRSTDEIATKLGLSTATVRNYVANLLLRLGVHSRLQAVVVARKAGLIEP